jgi:hypothetical protein
LPLSRFVQDPGAGRCTPELIDELAGLTARLIDAGFYHHDYHLGNLLIDPAAPPGGRLFVVDLHSVRLHGPGRRGLMRMLSMLSLSARNAGVCDDEQRAFLPPFLRGWRGGPGCTEDSEADLADRVKAARTRLHRAHMRSRTRRCVVESTMFTSASTGEFLVHRRRDFAVEVALRVVRMHEEAMGGPVEGVTVPRQGRRTEVTVCPCPSVPPLGGNVPARKAELRPGQVCVKAFKRAGPDRLKDVFRPRSRARAAWVAAQGFAVRGIPVARPIALLERRSRLSGGSDYLITEVLPAELTLDEFVERDAGPRAARCALGRAVAHLLRCMADEETYHPDTKPTNLLVAPGVQGPRLWLVDLDRAAFDRPWGRRQWVKSLARLNAGLPAQVTLLDRMRCLRQCGHGRWGRRERLEVARAAYDMSLTRRPAWLRQRPVRGAL